ncbi:MAG: lipocalin family protein [Blastocatellia bacterium]|nr:lipocalin family protein [Blastocatellia bacterium]
MLRKLLTVIFILSGTATLADVGQPKSLAVVPSVDLSRYTGKWYEIARLPNRFQKNCAGEVTATYSLLAGNQIRVVNECRRNNDQTEQAEGLARLANKNGPNSKLEVRFAPAWLSWLSAVWGDYWIIDLADDYSYSVVGTPDRKYLWILARTPNLDEAIYQRILQQTAAQGFAVAQLVKTRQSN